MNTPHSTPAPLSDVSCYRALAARDSRFDGVFFVGIKTTGIYCRPICTAKTARASSCTFYASAAAAEAAGFRPCLRCRPELAPYALQQNLAYAVWQRIAAGALNHRDEQDSGDLEQLAQEVGLSSRQLRRVLVQHFGVTPIELAQTQRLLFAKKLLQETALPMAVLADAAGFGSVRRFNALFSERYGMAPTAVRRQLKASAAQEADNVTVRLAYRPPFAWETMLRYLQRRLIGGVEAVQLEQEQSAYMRSVRIDGVSGWLRVTHLPPQQQLEVHVAPSLTPSLMPLLSRLRMQFDLDANPALIAQHLQQDPLLAQLLDAHAGIRIPGAFDAFELAVRAVLGQQVSVAGATTVAGRLAQRFGTPCATPFAAVSHHFPAAEQLAEVSALELATIGLPKTRAQTILNLARFAAQGHLQMKPGVTLQEAVAQLKTVAGIGDWTAQYIALRALRFPDAFPAGDLGLQKAVVPGTRLSERQLAAHAAPWAPWRGYAALLLWHSLG
ncbi:AlkA N-terminal domain-containing protein [Paraherbaspirillum soli]|uniref:DNA-3-methyladenine glycosylase II n=1 Tax=Paraherbaspirillum soli TaxID=631222 RepID=A0ABW0M6C7_9BURK